MLRMVIALDDIFSRFVLKSEASICGVGDMMMILHGHEIVNPRLAILWVRVVDIMRV